MVTEVLYHDANDPGIIVLATEKLTDGKILSVNHMIYTRVKIYLQQISKSLTCIHPPIWSAITSYASKIRNYRGPCLIDRLAFDQTTTFQPRG